MMPLIIRLILTELLSEDFISSPCFIEHFGAVHYKRVIFDLLKSKCASHEMETHLPNYYRSEHSTSVMAVTLFIFLVSPHDVKQRGS